MKVFLTSCIWHGNDTVHSVTKAAAVEILIFPIRPGQALYVIVTRFSARNSLHTDWISLKWLHLPFHFRQLLLETLTVINVSTKPLYKCIADLLIDLLTSFSYSVPKQSCIAFNIAGRILFKWRVRASPATADSMASARVFTGGVMSCKKADKTHLLRTT